MTCAIEEAEIVAHKDGLGPHGKWEFIKAKAREASRTYSIARMKKERAEKSD